VAHLVDRYSLSNTSAAIMSSLSDDDMEGEVEGEVEDGVDEAEEEAAPGAELTRFDCKEVSWEWAAKRCVKSIEAGDSTSCDSKGGC